MSFGAGSVLDESPVRGQITKPVFKIQEVVEVIEKPCFSIQDKNEQVHRPVFTIHDVENIVYRPCYTYEVRPIHEIIQKPIYKVEEAVEIIKTPHLTPVQSWLVAGCLLGSVILNIILVLKVI